MSEMELEREEILQALGKIALSNPNDAIALALNPKTRGVKGLDLWGVSEFKQGKDGNIELKFVDRVKAMDLLLANLSGGEDGMAALVAALEDEG